MTGWELTDDGKLEEAIERQFAGPLRARIERA